MNETIQFWIDYFGGSDVVYVILIALAATQLFKMLLKAFYGFINPDTVRPFPYLVGSITGLALIDFSSRGAMVGMVCGMISSLGYYGVSAWLEREAAPEWQKKLAKRMALK